MQISLSKLATFVLFGALCVVWCFVSSSNALVSYTNADSNQLDDQRQMPVDSVSVALIQNPKQVAHVLDSLLRSIIYSVNEVNTQSAQKRGLDLGMTRGFSGSQAGKHLMGLSAASFANGPGK